MDCFGLDRNGKGRIGIAANLSAAPPSCALASALRCTASRAHVGPPRRPAGSRNSGAMIKFLIATENYFQIKALLRFCVRARAIMRSDNWHERNRISSSLCAYLRVLYIQHSTLCIQIQNESSTLRRALSNVWNNFFAIAQRIAVDFRRSLWWNA